MKGIKFHSKKSLQKRVKILSKGILKCRHAGSAHLASHKTNQQKKRLGEPFLMSQSDVSRLRKIIGNKIVKKNTKLSKTTQKSEVLST